MAIGLQKCKTCGRDYPNAQNAMEFENGAANPGTNQQDNATQAQRDDAASAAKEKLHPGQKACTGCGRPRSSPKLVSSSPGTRVRAAALSHLKLQQAKAVTGKGLAKARAGRVLQHLVTGGKGSAKVAKTNAGDKTRARPGHPDEIHIHATKPSGRASAGQPPVRNAHGRRASKKRPPGTF